MDDLKFDNEMATLRWIWISLNIVLVIYAAFLFIYGKYYRKRENVIYVSTYLNKSKHNFSLNDHLSINKSKRKSNQSYRGILDL